MELGLPFEQVRNGKGQEQRSDVNTIRQLAMRNPTRGGPRGAPHRLLVICADFVTAGCRGIIEAL